MADELAPQLATSVTFSWLPEKINLVEGITLGAGFGSLMGSGWALILKAKAKTAQKREKIEMETMVAAGAVLGVAAGVIFVVAGNVGLL